MIEPYITWSLCVTFSINSKSRMRAHVSRINSSFPSQEHHKQPTQSCSSASKRYITFRIGSQQVRKDEAPWFRSMRRYTRSAGPCGHNAETRYCSNEQLEWLAALHSRATSTSQSRSLSLSLTPCALLWSKRSVPAVRPRENRRTGSILDLHLTYTSTRLSWVWAARPCRYRKGEGDPWSSWSSAMSGTRVPTVQRSGKRSPTTGPSLAGGSQQRHSRVPYCHQVDVADLLALQLAEQTTDQSGWMVYCEP